MENTIGSVIQHYRILKKWSVMDLSQRSGIATTTLHSIESGRYIPGFANARFLFDLVEVPESENRLLEQAKKRSAQSYRVKLAMEAFQKGQFPGEMKVPQHRSAVIDRIMEDLGLLSEMSFDDVLDYIKSGLTEDQKMEVLRLLIK